MSRNSDGTFAKSYATRTRSDATASGVRVATRNRATGTWAVSEAGKGVIATDLTREEANALVKENRE